MKIGNSILKTKENKVGLGDLIVTKDDYIFMIIKEDKKDGKYRLLRIKDGDAKTRKEDFEFTIAYILYNTIEELVEAKINDIKEIISNSELILDNAEGDI